MLRILTMVDSRFEAMEKVLAEIKYMLSMD